jgi:hypothetical protein
VKCNVGGIDRKVRFVAGIVLAGIAVFVTLPLTIKILIGILSVLSLASASFRVCYLNKWLGINTY